LPRDCTTLGRGSPNTKVKAPNTKVKGKFFLGSSVKQARRILPRVKQEGSSVKQARRIVRRIFPRGNQEESSLHHHIVFK